MNDNPKMVDLPWHDGTTRTVPEGTAYKAVSGYVFFARDGGYSSVADGDRIYQHHDKSVAARIFTEAPEPPVKVTVPTKIAAVVSMDKYPNEPGYVLTRSGWLGLVISIKYSPSHIAVQLRNGARVLFEGIEESENSL